MAEKWVRKALVLIFLMAIPFLFPEAMTAGDEKNLMMATTTSTDDTGLLDYLAPKFKEEAGIELRWTAVGTGKALKLGENCDVDVLLVHSPQDELTFVGKGFGTDRRQVMYNDFILIGPAADPADIKGKPLREALASLRANQVKMISRGDNSGTHKKEIELWKAADIPVPEKEPWYVQTGQGMMPTILMADEQKGYTLTDRGTYIKYENNAKGNPVLSILIEHDPLLLNQYSVISINKDHCPSVKKELAMTFIRWITSPKTQQTILDFKILGKSLFTPNANMP